jgi:hypothetical protein
MLRILALVVAFCGAAAFAQPVAQRSDKSQSYPHLAQKIPSPECQVECIARFQSCVDACAPRHQNMPAWESEALCRKECAPRYGIFKCEDKC